MHVLSAFPKNVHSTHPECYHKKSVVKCVEKKNSEGLFLWLLKITESIFLLALWSDKVISLQLQRYKIVENHANHPYQSQGRREKNTFLRKRETFHSKNVHAGIWKLLILFFEGFPLSVSLTREKLSKDFLFYDSWRMWATCLLLMHIHSMAIYMS